MKNLLTVVSLFLAFAAAGLSQKVDVAAELQSVVRAERAFSKMAAERGTRDAFLANMTDDAVVFGPEGADNGRKVWTARPQRPGLLSWEPTYADVARSGELAYTTGPWEFREKSAADKPVAHGQFMTVWRKEPDGTWKWILDIGTSNPPPATTPPSLEFPADFRKNTDKDKLNVNVAEVREKLLKLEREFSAASSKGTHAAFLAYAADDIRLIRQGSLPALGKEAMRRSLDAAPGTLLWQPAQAGASRSGELGYAYGTYEFRRGAQGGKPAAVERGNYVRVWKKKADGRWKVVLDLLEPFPPPPPPQQQQSGG